MGFQKSDIGAQAAWKGFSSQTLYIATRIIQDKGNYEFFPEDIEDLIIKNNQGVSLRVCGAADPSQGPSEPGALRAALSLGGQSNAGGALH